MIQEMRAVTRLELELGQLIADDEQRRPLLTKIRRVTQNVECPHNESHVLEFIVALFRLDPRVEGVIVEAGCFKGGSSAKLSLAAAMLGRELVVFDSFAGLPQNAEPHRQSILGHSIEGWFAGGEFAGALPEVRFNIEAFGDLDACRLIPGWFKDSMPTFDEPIAAVYMDVDLVESVRTCVANLYPRLALGGVFMSQDGDFPLVIELLGDRRFWELDVGYPMPAIEGLGTKKIVSIIKPAAEPGAPVATSS